MLIQFRFKNFRSFRDDTILDFSATKISEHADRIVSIGGEKLLPVAAIYGANAGGKSNVIKAFEYMAMYVVLSFSYGGDLADEKSKINIPKLTPFLFDAESMNAPSTFEVYFIDNEEHGFKTCNYGFSVGQDGVEEEWLNTKAKTSKEYKRVFYRSRDELDLSGLPAKSRENLLVSLQKETLIVSLGAKLNIEKLKAIRDWFLNNADVINFGNLIENFFRFSSIPDNFMNEQNIRRNVVRYFSAFDSSIKDFDVETYKSDDGEEHYKISAVHEMADGKKMILPLREESDGTQKMFALYQPLQDALERGGALFIDELNARLHPLLVKNFLLAFLNPEINKNHAQLVFTTHDSSQLSNNLLRRDEIWFTEKDENGVSTLYSLADFVDEDGSKIRKDESFEKNYLLGKYGAIPSLRYFDMFDEE